MITAKQFLTRAKTLIADPAKWTQGATARDAQGNSVPATSEDACRWCSVGASIRMRVELEDSGLMPPDGTPARKSLIEGIDAGLRDTKFDTEGIACFNDEHTHAEVMAEWDKMIAAAP